MVLIVFLFAVGAVVAMRATASQTRPSTAPEPDNEPPYSPVTGPEDENNEFSYIPNFEPQETVVEQDGGSYVKTYDHTNHPLLKLIQKRESGGDYYVVYGGRKFTDTSTHPYAGWKVGTAPVGKGEFTRQGIAPAIVTIGTNKGQPSSAAGKYQFLIYTWVEHANLIGLFDFTPDTQDRLAYSLCDQIGAIKAFANGDLEKAIRKCATKWTSLPSASTGEVTVSMSLALEELRSFT